MKTVTQCHMTAITELVEMISIGGLVAVAADILWLICDIIACSMARPELFVVAGLLIIAFIISGYGLFMYHKSVVKKLLHEKLLIKLAAQKYKNKHKQNA